MTVHFLEVLHRVWARHPCALGVTSKLNLFLRAASGEKLYHRINQRKRVRHIHDCLFEQDAPTAARTIRWDEWDRVLLARVSYAAEPGALMLAT